MKPFNIVKRIKEWVVASDGQSYFIARHDKAKNVFIRSAEYGHEESSDLTYLSIGAHKVKTLKTALKRAYDMATL